MKELKQFDNVLHSHGSGMFEAYTDRQFMLTFPSGCKYSDGFEPDMNKKYAAYVCADYESNKTRHGVVIIKNGNKYYYLNINYKKLKPVYSEKDFKALVKKIKI